MLVRQILQHNTHYVIPVFVQHRFFTEQAQHNTHYVIFNRCSVWRFYFLYNQSHIFHAALMFGTGGNNIDACGVDVRVTENVC